MKVDDFASNFFKNSNQSLKLWDSPKFDKVNNIFWGSQNVNPMLVTTAWQTLLESPDLSDKL